MSKTIHAKTKAATAAAKTNTITAEPTLSVTEMLIREANAKAQAEAEAMRQKREANERKRVAAAYQAETEAARRKEMEATRKAEAERQRIAAAEAAKARHEREIVAWEATYRVYAPLADLLDQIEADRKRDAENRTLRVKPFMASHERALENVREYVRFQLNKIKEVLISGNTGVA